MSVFTGKMEVAGISRENAMEASLKVSLGYADSESDAAKSGALVVAVPGEPNGHFTEDKVIGGTRPSQMKSNNRAMLDVGLPSLDTTPTVRIETYTGFTYKVLFHGKVYKPGEDRSKEALFKDLRTMLLPGVPCRFSHKSTGEVVSEGVVSGALLTTKGGATQVRLEHSPVAVTILANMWIDIFELPRQMQEEERQQKLERKLKGKAEVDPYPALTRHDMAKALSARGCGPGSYIVHSSVGVASPHPCFRLLTVTYIPPDDVGDGHGALPPGQTSEGGLCSFPIYMAEPTPDVPAWLPFPGWLTLYEAPWEEEDPNPLGMSEGLAVFRDFRALHTRYDCLQTRHTPYPSDAMVSASGLLKGAEEGEEEEEERNVMGYTVASNVIDKGRAVQFVAEEESEDDEGETPFVGNEMQAVMARRRNQQRALALAVIILLAVGAGLMGYYLRPESGPLATPKPVVQVVATPAPPPPPSYVDFVSKITGSTVDAWTAAVRSAYACRVALSLSIACDLMSVTSVTASSRRDGNSTTVRSLLAIGVDVGTRITTTNKTQASSVYAKLQTPAVQSTIKSQVSAELASKGINATMNDLDVKQLVIGGETPVTPVATTPPPQSVIECGPYPASPNFTLSPAGKVAYPLRAAVVCKVGYRLTPGAPGSVSPFCQIDGTFQLPKGCSGCGAGQYVTSQTANCEECTRGAASSLEAASFCPLCPVSTYADQAGQIACKVCPNGTVTLKSGSTSASDCKCAPGYFSSLGAVVCQACPPSTYTSTTESASCTPCPANSLSFVNGSTAESSCMCNVGYYPESRSPLVCSPCAIGSYKFLPGNSNCSACPAGSSTASTGTVGVERCVCNPGFSASWPYTGGVITTNITVLENITTVLPTLVDNQVTTVDVNLLGQEDYNQTIYPFNSSDLQTSTTFTKTETFAAYRMNLTSYEKTITTTTALRVNSTLNITIVKTIVNTQLFRTVTYRTNWTDQVKDRTVVMNETWIRHSGVQTCTQCPQGQHTASWNPTSLVGSVCSLCPSGTFSTTATSVCSDCAAGEGETASRTSCLPCPKGRFAASSRTASCSACAPGTYTASLSSTSCSSCDAGFAAQTGSSVCTRCQPGTAAASGSATCALCAKGSYSSFTAPSCTDCGAGFFTSSEGSSSCSTCPEGTYSNVSRASFCATCVAGTSAPFGRSVCTSCSPGTFSGDQAAVCTNCISGKFQPLSGASQCLNCQPSSASEEGADTSDKCICNVPGQTRSSDGVCVGYWVSGVQYNLTESTLTDGGWQMCKEVAYNSPMTLSTALDACSSTCGSSDRVLFGAKMLGTTLLTLAAMGSTRTTEVVNPTVAVQNPITNGDSNGTRLHNGVYWYQSTEAFGFSPVPEIALTVIDKAATNCSGRLSWNIEASGSGYRAGCTCKCDGAGCESGSCPDEVDLSSSSGANWIKAVWCTS